MKKIVSTILVCVLLLGCVFALASCGAPDSDPKKAEEALKKEGYTVFVRENYDGCVYTVSAQKDDVKEKKFDDIEIRYYADEAAAENAWKTLEALYAKEAESKEGTDYEIKYGIDGTVIYKGTVDAVKAAN